MSDHTPSAGDYAALAATHVLVPVVREVLADVSTPVSVYSRLRGPGSFLLESVEHGERWGRYSFIGLSPLIELRARGGTVEVSGAVHTSVSDAAATGDPLTTAQALIDWLTVPDLPGLPPLFAGLVGYLGWDVVRFIERLPATGLDDRGLDDARLMVPGQVVAFDHLRQRLIVVTNTLPGQDPGAAHAAAVAVSEALVALLAEPVRAPVIPPPRPTTVEDAEVNMTPAAYQAAVEAAQDHITAGDAFQVVPSQRFTLATDVDPLAVHRVLRVINPSPYMYLFDFGDLQVVGSSPEALVTVHQGQAQIWPIAGSQPRGATEAEDLALEAALLGDAKERAEHVMLVDLARNDLGRISDVGSIVVEDFMSVVRYSHIMHLVSRVSGRVRDGMGPIDVIRATFPAGTLSGAPKVRAMEIIDDLEPTRRGIYGGGIGYIDLAGNADLCIAIRTLVFHHGRADVQAGAGVVADSVPATEYAETRNKAMALLSAVRAAEAWAEGMPMTGRSLGLSTLLASVVLLGATAADWVSMTRLDTVADELVVERTSAVSGADLAGGLLLLSLIGMVLAGLLVRWHVVGVALAPLGVTGVVLALRGMGGPGEPTTAPMVALAALSSYVVFAALSARLALRDPAAGAAVPEAGDGAPSRFTVEAVQGELTDDDEWDLAVADDVVPTDQPAVGEER